MKTKHILHGAAALLMAVAITACNQTKDAAGKVADTAKDTTTKAVDTAKDAVASAMDSARDAVVKAGGPVGEAVAAAKKACDEKNYSGALDELKKLANVQLTPEQQKVVDGMKESITKMMPDAAAKATDAAAGAVDAAKSAVPK